MSFSRGFDRLLGSLDTWELVYIGLVLGVALQQWMTSDDPGRVTEQQMTLGEDDLRRLEDGGSLALPRWHGNELHLRGDVVVDIPATEESGGGVEEGADE